VTFTAGDGAEAIVTVDLIDVWRNLEALEFSQGEPAAAPAAP
jgi:hypothetical protein